MGSGAADLPKSSETVSSYAARTKTEKTEESPVSEPGKTAATVGPTESEIATVAYQLWLDKGCPAGSDQEDWLRAEAMLKNGLVANCEDLSRRPSISRCEARIDSEKLAEFRYGENWEVWESEWGGARWMWGHSRVEVSNRAA